MWFVQLTDKLIMFKTTHKPFLSFKPQSFELINFYKNEKLNMAKDKSVARLPNI